MSTIAAIVTGLVGQVFAISADGLRRQIFEGDRLLQGEQVITGLGGEVVLQLADGEELRLGGSSRWQAGVQEASVDERRTAAVGDLEQALAAGLDPTLELEASAAGGGAGGSGSGDGGGHSFVQLSETALRVDPLIGFVTGSMVVGDDSIIEDQGGEALSASAESPAPGSNTPPVGSDLVVVAAEDTPISGQVTASDVDGDSLTFAKGSDPSHGSVTVAADGSWTYTPNPDYHGPDSFTVVVSDGQGGSDTITVDVTVMPVNDDPVGTGGSVTTTENTPVSGQVTASDVDGDSLTFAKGSDPSHGSVTVDSDGRWTYTANPDYHGPDSFTVVVSDGQGGSDTLTVDVIVMAVNDAPLAQNDAVTVSEDVPFSSSISLLANDSDVDGDSLSVVAGTFVTAQGGSIVIAADGSYTY
ncbi:retention module-containing protein, partial [Pseudomonas stutzeri]|nr:retention module-containing protein [Stutzerimonas stutzeri]